MIIWQNDESRPDENFQDKDQDKDPDDEDDEEEGGDVYEGKTKRAWAATTTPARTPQCVRRR